MENGKKEKVRAIKIQSLIHGILTLQVGDIFPDRFLTSSTSSNDTYVVDVIEILNGTVVKIIVANEDSEEKYEITYCGIAFETSNLIEEGN